MKVTKAVIPCAGYGTRLFPVTKLVPKELLPIGTKPAIQYIVEEAVAAGITDIILVCSRNKLSIADYFRADAALHGFLQERGKDSELKQLKAIEEMAKVTVVYQETPKGLGDAVLCARREVGNDPFLVSLPDDLIFGEPNPVPALIDACSAHNLPWGLMLKEVQREKITSYGIISGDVIGHDIYGINGAVEKPAPEEAPSNLGILGRYLLDPTIFEALARASSGSLGEIQLTNAINTLARTRPGCGLVCRNRLFDIGTMDGLLSAWSYINPRRQ